MKYNYSAITLDTNIFIHSGYDLEGGLLSKFSQFKTGHVKFILSDIIYQEVLKHLTAKLSEEWAKLVTATRHARRHSFLEEPLILKLEEATRNDQTPYEIAKKRIDSFIQNTGTIVVPSGEVSIKKVVEMYFAPFPPFEKVKAKKDEFPDAIALLAIQAWAQNNRHRILAVSDDGGWADFAKDNEVIYVVSDLAEGLEMVQPRALEVGDHSVAGANSSHPIDRIFGTALPDEISQSNIPSVDDLSVDAAGREGAILSLEQVEVLLYKLLTKKYDEETCSDFHQRIKDAVVSGVAELYDIEAEADSATEFEADYATLTSNSFEFIKDGSTYDCQIIQIESDKIVARIGVEVKARAEAEFHFSGWDSVDRESFSLGSNTKSTDVEFDAAILVTLEGEFSGRDANFSVTTVEFTEGPESVDFGYVDLSRDDDWYDEETR